MNTTVSGEFRKTVEYEGFTIEFILPERIKNYIEKTGFDLNTYLTDTQAWFVEYLFEVLDWDKDGAPDTEFGKEFQVIVYGIVDKIEEGTPYGLLEDVNYEHTARVFGRARREKIFDELIAKMKPIREEEMSFKSDFQLIEVTLRKY